MVAIHSQSIKDEHPKFSQMTWVFRRESNTKQDGFRAIPVKNFDDFPLPISTLNALYWFHDRECQNDIDVTV